jgi:hypothetical protein
MMQPHICHQFKSPVWRLEIDSLTDTIFAEIREASDKRVSFASISLESGKTWFEDLQTEDRWLTGMEAAYDGVLLLHNYQSEGGPAHKGLVALDALTGKALWQNFNYTFDHLTINGPLFYDARLQPRRLFLANIKNGTTVRGYEPSIDLELTNYLAFPAEAPAEYVEALHLPVRPLENTAHYLEHNNLIIVSLHAITGGTLQQHLYIMRGTEVVYEDLLNTRIQKLQPESFLIHKDQLICLKDLSQLKVFKL